MKPGVLERRFGLLTALAVVVFVVAAARVALVTPLFEAPDENSHADYLGILHWTGEAPIPLRSADQGGGARWLQTALGHHPPLYYLLLSSWLELRGIEDFVTHAERTSGPSRAWWLHGRDELAPVAPAVRLTHELRLFSMLLGALSLVATYAILRLVAPRAPAAAWLGTWVLATNGGWIRSHAVLDNGTLCVTALVLCTWVLSGAVRARRLSLSRALMAGALTAIALWSKLTGLLGFGLIGSAGVLVALAGRVERRGRPLLAATGGVILALLLWWPWVERNLELFGEPLGIGAHERAYAESVLPPDARWRHLLLGLPAGVWRTAAGPIGWGRIEVPLLAEFALGAFLALAAVGLWRRRRDLGLDPWTTLFVLLAGLGAALLLLRFNMVFAQPQARYANAGAPAAAACVGLGLAAWSRGRAPAQARLASLAVLSIGSLGLGGFLAETEATWAESTTPRRALPIVSVDLHAEAANPDMAPPAIEVSTEGQAGGGSLPPRITWDREQGPCSLVFWVEHGPRFGGTWETLGSTLNDGSFRVPQPIWDYLEPGDELSVALRRLAPDGTRSGASPTVRVRR